MTTNNRLSIILPDITREEEGRAEGSKREALKKKLQSSLAPTKPYYASRLNSQLTGNIGHREICYMIPLGSKLKKTFQGEPLWFFNKNIFKKKNARGKKNLD